MFATRFLLSYYAAAVLTGYYEYWVSETERLATESEYCSHLRARLRFGFGRMGAETSDSS